LILKPGNWPDSLDLLSFYDVYQTFLNPLMLTLI
jgi:hypothetical protein